MFSSTHKQIAKRVYQALVNELDIMLDYQSLLFGSIAPDILPSMLLMSHTRDGSIRLVNKHIDWLSSRTLLEKEKSIRKFSFRLGIIIHFISDYFCKAHNEERYDNLLIHFAYERKLKNCFNKQLKKCPNSSVFNIKKWDIDTDIKSFIDIKHKEHNSLKRSLTNDISYSISISTIVALNILLCCIGNSNEEVHMEEFKGQLKTA